MTIRTIIMLLTVPLFLLMAIVNGAVLYVQEQSEISDALAEQARAAAVVAGEFISGIDDPAMELGTPQRRAALDAAVARIDGLEGLYLIERSGRVTPLVSASLEWSPPVLWQGDEAQTAGFEAESEGTPHFVAVVPAGTGRAVAARIDGSPLLENRARIGWIVGLIIAGVSVFSAALSWFVARRVVRELRANGQSIAAIGEGAGGAAETNLSIRETRDLADAVSLMKASRDAAEIRQQRESERRSRERNIQAAAGELHSSIFPPALFVSGSTRIAVRVCGDPPTGAFFAIPQSDAGALVVIGRCTASHAQEGLAKATAARRFVEANLANLGQEQCLALGRQAYDIEELHCLVPHSAPNADAQLSFACIAEDDVATQAHTAHASSEGMSPEQLLNAIEALLAPSGVFAAAATNR